MLLVRRRAPGLVANNKRFDEIMHARLLVRTGQVTAVAHVARQGHDIARDGACALVHAERAVAVRFLDVADMVFGAQVVAQNRFELRKITNNVALETPVPGSVKAR